MKALFRTFIFAGMAALLTGCITSSEQRAQRIAERCESRGLKPNTNEFTSCVQAFENEREARMEMRRRELLERSSSPLPPLR